VPGKIYIMDDWIREWLSAQELMWNTLYRYVLYLPVWVVRHAYNVKKSYFETILLEW
jgi:hypothetical protein